MGKLKTGQGIEQRITMKNNKIMTNLIILLISLNVFYFVWSYIDRYTYTPPPVNQEGVPSITLLPRVASSPKGSPEHSNCYTFGPFGTIKAARYISRRINNYGLATSIKKQKTMQTLNFLVYLQPFSSRKEAEEVVEKIKKQKVKEFMIIDSGPYKNAIALGSFDNLDKARRHAEYIRFLQYDARYTAQKKQKEVFWVNYDEPVGSRAPVLDWIKEIDLKVSVQKIPTVCEF